MNLTPQGRDDVIRTLVGEASDQGADGLAAVAWVIRNRASWLPSAWWGFDMASVALKREQFSCWNGGPDTDRIKAMATDSVEYLAAESVLDAVLDGTISDPTGGATTYKVTGTRASWDVAVQGEPPRIIGKHSLWRLSPLGPCLAFLNTPSASKVA